MQEYQGTGDFWAKNIHRSGHLTWYKMATIYTRNNTKEKTESTICTFNTVLKNRLNDKTVTYKQNAKNGK